MMAGLVDIPDKILYCGATIISKRYVLTASRCVQNRDLNLIFVVVGEHDVTTGSEYVCGLVRCTVVRNFWDARGMTLQL
ncbi:hypothetical protein ONE63_011597 [Megalurothrips usitatus]|uniref:Peptidase S1 domain-containing protein n=1 Tax=Megalurothrips usitatus TaxID=439358 RepID=A0AAV7WYU4_9NEOP|nr:hypothetical protein ONE63_011597 [Megalurothrips usitatus]